MAESLGDALLTLRTDDGPLEQGLRDARRKAEQTMNDLAAAQARATTENQAAKAAYKAGEITLEQYNRKLLETKADLAQVDQAHRAATKGLQQFEQQSKGVATQSAAQKAGMQQLSYQIGDVATMYSLGARPTQIFASQIGQVTQAIQLATGGTSKLAAFLGGPWGMALTAATIVLAPFVAKLFEAEKAMEAVEFSSDAMGDAQGILGSVIDLTTGKIKDQTSALWQLARAQAMSGVIEARARATELKRTLKGEASEKGDIVRVGGVPMLKGGMFGPTGFMRADSPTAKIAQGILNGSLDTETAINRLNGLTGKVPDAKIQQMLSAVSGLGVENANVDLYEKLLAALNGDQGALEEFLNRPGPKKPPRPKTPPKPKGPTPEQLQERFEGQDAQLQRETLQAQLQLADTADERAAIQAELLALERDQRLAEIEASDLNDKQKAALKKRVEELLGKDSGTAPDGTILVNPDTSLQGRLDARAYAAEIERENAALAQARFEAETEALQIQLSLADTEAERKRIALKLLEADERYLEYKLQEVLNSKVADENAKAAAQIALDAQRATAPGRREEVARANETTVERYLRDLQKTPDQINEAIDRIKIGGLEDLNDGLVDTLMHAKSVGEAFRSLGDIFKSVADQIVADLLRIAIQQMVVKPLATSLFGGGGGDGGAGGFFAGLFAEGGTIPTGQFGIVGEEGPEIAFAGPGGLGILSNSDSKRALTSGGESGGTNFTFNMPVDATGADPAAIGRLNSRLDRLERDLPATIIGTVRDAQDRRYLPGGAR
ncbi:MAG: hypothetical protein CL949_12800 [Erythrobacter sp.]|nr:hypothetical protein [Erythrobacter sp.]